ncbi:MAG: hypothetical protein KA361_02070 [Chromatiaceae bacterium]|nr:hypothetical protein [Chromatiaceae bacterium]MBP8024399.1 hypothetical protein [Chromatiaceae bacterium]MBP9604349.1 hypothetical protein [Chromatiaceae bacterium]
MSLAEDAAPERGGGTSSKRRLKPLLAMVIIFAAPSLGAWFLYFNPEYLPSGRANLGELISPVVPIPANLDLITPEGAPLDREALMGKWTLVFLAGRDCADPCQSRIRDLRQIRLALGEGSLSTERLLIMVDPDGQGRDAELAREFGGMRVVRTNVAGGKDLLDLLGQGDSALGRIYILDPMGNLMMRYAPDAPAKDTLKDMGRLIKASRNWIKGAGYGHK